MNPFIRQHSLHMSAKKEFTYWKEVEKEHGTIVKFSIFKKGKSIFIETDSGYEHIVHPSARSVDDEIRIVFKAKVIRTIMPGQE